MITIRQLKCGHGQVEKLKIPLPPYENLVLHQRIQISPQSELVVYSKYHAYYIPPIHRTFIVSTEDERKMNKRLQMINLQLHLKFVYDCAWSGIVIINVVPMPKLLFTCTLPPCNVTTCLTIARPRPVPSISGCLASSAR